MKKRVKIPRTAIIVIIIASIGLGAKGIKYIADYSNGKQDSRGIEKTASAEKANPGTIMSFGGVQPARSLSDYQLIIENDLLKPLGWQKTRETPPPPEPVVQRERRQERPEPVNDLILTGITRLGQEPIAIVEDVPRGEAYFLREGDKLKNYVVEAIAEENITLVNGESRITASLGSKTHYNRDGQILASEMAGGQTVEGMVKDSGEEPVLLEEDTADLSIIERMKARRRKELE